jgi:hypothetical protein
VVPLPPPSACCASTHQKHTSCSPLITTTTGQRCAAPVCRFRGPHQRHQVQRRGSPSPLAPALLPYLTLWVVGSSCRTTPYCGTTMVSAKPSSRPSSSAWYPPRPIFFFYIKEKNHKKANSILMFLLFFSNCPRR